MTLNNVSDVEVGKFELKYKLEPPEGGWGYVIMISVAVMFICAVAPLGAFGIIYGKYLATIGDEASATAIVNCIFHTVLSFMGLVANHLLQKHSYRFVGILGSLFLFLGNFLTVFASSVGEMIVTFGILQGTGFGLMLPSTLTAFNVYFVRRNIFIMSISQTIVAASCMLVPYLANFLIDEFGYRGTVAIFSAISLHAFVAMLTLQPVEWHMIKVPFTALEMSLLPPEDDKTEEKCQKYNRGNDDKYLSDLKKNTSGLSKLWNSIYCFLELSLLQDPTYVNIAVGISLSYISDVMFVSLLPMFLSHMKYSKWEIAYLMTIFLAADLLGRLLLAFLTAAVTITNRILFLCGTTIITLVRIAFALNSGNWILITILISMLGLLRCLIQIPILLVLAEYSQSKFTAAFSLYMNICGIASLIIGQLISFIASITIGDTWVQHLLTLQLILCAFPWTVEIIYNKLKK